MIGQAWSSFIPYYSVIQIVSVSYIEPALELPLVPHLDVDPLVQAQPDQIQRLLNSCWSGLTKNYSRLNQFHNFFLDCHASYST